MPRKLTDKQEAYKMSISKEELKEFGIGTYKQGAIDLSDFVTETILKVSNTQEVQSIPIKDLIDVMQIAKEVFIEGADGV